MPDYNKGDFTQQGVDGFVEGGLHLNEKRCLTAKISSDEETAGLGSVEINIHDHLNDLDYTFSGENVIAGTSVIGQAPSGNIAITENTAEGEPLNIAQYATATVNVAGGGGTPTEVVYISGTFTPEYSAEAQAYIATIDTPAVIAQKRNDLFVLTVGNKTENVIIATDNDQIPGAILPLEPETPDESFRGVMPLAVGSPTVIIAPDSNPVFIELKQVIGALDIDITSDQTGTPLFYLMSNGSGNTWDTTTAVYKPDFENHINIPYCGVKRAYISISTNFSYQNAVNCRVEAQGANQVIVIYDNNASIDLTFVQ